MNCMPIRRWIVLLLVGIVGSLLAGCTPEPTATPIPLERAMQRPTRVPYSALVPRKAPSPREQAAAPPTLPTFGAPLSAPTEAPSLERTAPPTAAPRRAGPPKVGDVAIDFTLPDLDGNQVSLSDFRGKRVMLNFWATWCGPCRIEIPHMVALYDELRDEGFEIVAVNLREDEARASKFTEEMGMQFPVLLDERGKIGAAYFVRGIPTSIFLDDKGVIQLVRVGSLRESALRKYVADLMG